MIHIHWYPGPWYEAERDRITAIEVNRLTLETRKVPAMRKFLEKRCRCGKIKRKQKIYPLA